MTPRINRAGMGTLGDPYDPYGPGGLYDPNAGPLYDPNQLPTYGTSPTFPQQGQYSPFKIALPGLIAGGLKVVDDILAPTAATQARYGAQYSSQQYRPATYGTPPAGYYYDSAGQLVRLSGSGGVGFGFDSQGIRLSDGSHIGWFPIVGVIGIIFLLQSPGFTRKGR